MQLVVDANVVFSALVNKGKAFTVFASNARRKRFIFIAPEFAFVEIEKKRGKILSVTVLSSEEQFDIISFIREQTEVIPFDEFSDFIPEARLINPDDAPYLALAIQRDCAIFSGDKGLKKQQKVDVFSPRELLDILGDK